MISDTPFDPHTLKPFEPHPCFAARLEESFLGREKLGEFLERKTLEGPALRGIQETLANIIPVTGKELFYAITGYEIDAYAAQRRIFLFYEQH